MRPTRYIYRSLFSMSLRHCVYVCVRVPFWQCSGVNSWFCSQELLLVGSGDHTACQGSKPDWSHIRHVLYPLYSHSGSIHYFNYLDFQLPNFFSFHISYKYPKSLISLEDYSQQGPFFCITQKSTKNKHIRAVATAQW